MFKKAGVAYYNTRRLLRKAWNSLRPRMEQTHLLKRGVEPATRIFSNMGRTFFHPKYIPKNDCTYYSLTFQLVHKNSFESF